VKEETVGDWIGIFRIIGEVKNSCRESADSLKHALKEVGGLSKYVESLDKALMHKYNIESTPKEKSID
jgi:hypothetical protein